MKRGLMHVYMGDGKGKTTAAVGLCVRAAGTGQRVVFVQFMKGGRTGEIHVLKQLEHVTVLRSEKNFGFYAQMSETDQSEITQVHNELFKRAIDIVDHGECDLLILDELTYPYEWNLISKEMVDELIRNKPERLELVVTGRNPAAVFMEHADYITEMKAVRHPYERGIKAREGIEF